MVTANLARNATQRGALIAELIVAMAMLVIAMLPLAYAATSDAHQLRTTYQKAIAREILDGEMEMLAAGAWQNIPEGVHDYSVTANAKTNLPPGNFRVSRKASVLRLEWIPTQKTGIGTLSREVKIK